MTLHPDRFGEFFAAVNDGKEPFSWQQELLEQVVRTGTWPDVIAAPTGSGKSAAVDIHVFANALSAVGAAVRVPRRMAVVVNRRGLVDRHAQHAADIAALLAQGRPGILGEVADALAGVSITGQPLALGNLRGGLPRDADWLNDPSACAVIAATPDMWGSRLLMRGYGSTRWAWPREAGLAGYDCVLLIDEAHLNRQFQQTATDVARIARDHQDTLGIPALQVVAMTATPPPNTTGTTLGVDPTTISPTSAPDADLARRMSCPKQVSYRSTDTWPRVKGPASVAHIKLLAETAAELALTVPATPDVAGTVGCFVNRVDTAVRLAELLAGQVGESAVACWVGRMRPMDLERLQQERPGLFTVAGDHTVRYLVATQTVEVGVDIDLAGLVTELADGSALAQRFGRVNRLGLRPYSRIEVIGPEPVATDYPPYGRDDLIAAKEWVQRREAQGGVSPIELLADPAPQPGLPRLVLSDLTPGHADYLTTTSTPLFAEPDLTFWLRDDLTSEDEPVSVIVRHLPDDDSAAMALLAAAPPESSEAFPARIGDARKVIAAILEGPEDNPHRRCFRWVDRTVTQIEASGSDGAGASGGIRPGDVLVVDSGHPLTLHGVLFPEASKPEPLTLGTGAGVLRAYVRVPRDRQGWSAADDEVLDTLSEVHDDQAQELFEDMHGDPSDPLHGKQVFLGPHTDADPADWAVVRDISADDELRQEWTQAATSVPLSIHQQAVAHRADTICQLIGLAPPVARAVTRAAAHHDDGKIDPRFQTQVLNATDSTPLAKSAGGAQRVRRRATASGLPLGWRHEQMSAAFTWSQADQFAQPELVTRLVGTSHGRGRPFFPHAARPAGDLPAGRLLATDGVTEVARQAAYDLFATGAGWDDILHQTTATYGPWGCAYLEALLRAADCTISKEGS